MSMILMAKAMSITVGNPLRKLVLIKLADNANDKGECWPSYQHIADQCEISKRSVMRHIDDLCEVGFLRKEYRPGPKGNSSNIYHLSLDSDRKSPEVVTEIHPPSDTESPPPSDTESPRTSHSFEPVNEPNNPPKAPKGEFSEEVLSQAKQVLEYYNEVTGTTCRSAEAFAVLLTERPSREAYTVDDLKLVVRWVAETWKRRNGTVAKPANICRVNRFDGYLADATQWDENQVEVDCGAVIDAYNDLAAGRLMYAEIDEDRVKAIRRLATHFPREKAANECFRNYFSAFFNEARASYFGKSNSGWHANFDWLMKPDTLLMIRRGNHV